MKPPRPWWWREGDLNPQELALLQAVLAAHHHSAMRPNASSVCLANAAAGTGRFDNALAAAILSTGGLHAPLIQTCRALELEAGELEEQIEYAVQNGERIPGWGSSFHKRNPDPKWQAVDACLRQSFKPMAHKLEVATQTLHRLGKRLYPNPSAYTAAAALILGIPPETALWLFVTGRLGAWAQVFLSQQNNA